MCRYAFWHNEFLKPAWLIDSSELRRRLEFFRLKQKYSRGSSLAGLSERDDISQVERLEASGFRLVGKRRH